MKYLVKFFVITTLLFVCTNIHAEQKIVFIDMKQVLNESKAGKFVQELLIKTHNANVASFKKIEEDLKKDETDLLSKKNRLKEDEYNKKIKDLRNKVKEYQEKRSLKLEKITQQRAKAKTTLLSAIQPILSDYSLKNNILMIFDKKDVVLGKTENDITQAIIKQLDKKLPSLDLK